MYERTLLNVADKIDSLGGIGIRLRPIALCGWAELHLRRDLIAGAQRCRARVGDIEPRFAVRHVRAREQYSQPAAVLIRNRVLRHPAGERLQLVRGRDSAGVSRAAEAAAYHPKPIAADSSASITRRRGAPGSSSAVSASTTAASAAGSTQCPVSRKCARKIAAEKPPAQYAAFRTPSPPLSPADIINKFGGREQVPPPDFVCLQRFSPIGAPPEDVEVQVYTVLSLGIVNR